MFTLKSLSIMVAGSVAVAGCMSAGVPANRGTTYQCSNGTKLQISYLRNSALVSVNDARPIPFAQTPSNAGQVYENAGSRIAREGNAVTWNTAARSAPEQCRPVMTTN